MKPTILTCAVTGTFPTRAHNPALPVTPEEIAVACIGAAKAGAAICHIHVREPTTGLPSMKLAYYREVVQRIKASGTDLIINLTAGPGGRYMPSDADPAVAGPGTNLVSAEIRTEHIVELKPEICTLDLNTNWFGGGLGSPQSPPHQKFQLTCIFKTGFGPTTGISSARSLTVSRESFEVTVSGGSTFARVKLKEIDGMAPQDVERAV